MTRSEVLHHLYVLGGWVDGKECTSSIECYDSGKNTWEEKNSLILPRKLFGSTYHKGLHSIIHSLTYSSMPYSCTHSLTHRTNSIYCFGGLIDNLLCTNRVEAYSLDDNTTSECAPLPFVGSTSAITTDKDLVYVVIHGKCIVLYDPLQKKNTVLASLPLPEWFCFDISYFGTSILATLLTFTYSPIHSLGDKIFLVGGVVNGKFSDAFYEYDIKSNTFLEKPRMISRRRRCACATMCVQ